MKEIPEFIILNKDRLLDVEINEIREHCKDNKGISIHENDIHICVRLLDESEIPFHSYIFDLLYKTAERR